MHPVVAFEERQHAFPGGDTTRAVQEEQCWTLTRLEDLDGRSSLAELDHPRERGAHDATGRSAWRRAPSFWLPGTVRSFAGRGRGDQRSSASAKIGRSCGITCVAKRYVDRFVRSIGEEPMWKPSARCPILSERASSSSCWRTVAGDPATR